jgi:hypothetical protein
LLFPDNSAIWSVRMSHRIPRRFSASGAPLEGEPNFGK